MSKSREASGKGPSKGVQKPAEVVWPPPLKPRKGLFIVLAIVLVGLFAGMLVLYFKTVYPTLH
jgi:hypothetical protein